MNRLRIRSNARSSTNPQTPKRPQPDDVVGVDLQNLGNDRETYRWFFLEENNRRKDEAGKSGHDF